MSYEILASFVIALSFHLSHGQFECPPPWLKSEDSCYKFELFEKTYAAAAETCDIDGAALVSVNSFEENNFITEWLSQNALSKRLWYTSGKKKSGDEYFWEGDGTNVEGQTFWLDEDARQLDGDTIVYGTYGQLWGWMVGESRSVNQEIPRPYICEISKAEVYKIVEGEKGYEYGTAETDPSKFQTGPEFISQPRNVLFDKEANQVFLSIEAIAIGNPDPLYEWYKTTEQSRQQVNPEEDSRFTITNGKLTINNPQNTANDNGRYQCVASNRFGSIISNTVTISFTYLNDFPNSPRNPVEARDFQGVGIECNPPTNNYPQLFYQWQKDGQFIYTDRKPYIFKSLNGKLYFSYVTRDDAGFYSCLVSVPEGDFSVPGGRRSKDIELRVIAGLGSPSEPQIESGFPAVYPNSPKVGDNVTLECFARGYTTEFNGMQYAWSKVDGYLPDNAQQLDFNRVLYIPNIQQIHSGDYACTVRQTNQGGQKSGTVSVGVEAVPYFTIPLRNQHVDAGGDLRWQCVADGKPAVTYTWYRNGVQLTADTIPEQDRARYSIQNNVLTISALSQQRDDGMYQCGATNSHGTRYSSAQLRVLRFAPSFAKYPIPERIYGTLQGNVTILCRPEAAPSAVKVWSKDNRILFDANAVSNENDRVHILPNGNLRLTRLRDADEGVYRCEASNDLDSAWSEGTLTVLPTTQISNQPIDTVVKVNDTAFFHCEASYNPAIDITYDWYHNDYHIQFIKIRVIGDTQHIEIEEHFERGRGINQGGLYIKDVQYYHQGEYTCIAKSTSEEISRRAKLTVTGPPYPPVGVYATDVTAVSCRVHWGMGDLDIATNGHPIIAFIVEMKHEDALTWSRAKGELTGAEITSMVTTVEGLTPASTYRFRVRAKNVLGEGAPSRESDSITTAEAPPVTAPRWVGRCIGKVGTLCIAWTRVPLEERNGQGFGYTVLYKREDLDDDQWNVKEVDDPEADHHVALVGEGNTYQLYDVVVRTRNNLGQGPITRQSEARIRSAMGMPAAQPTELRVWQHNATALLVEWDVVANTIEQMKGNLSGYRINYWEACCQLEEMALFKQVLGQVGHGMIIGLWPDTKYWVNVQVYNEAGFGAKMDALEQDTLRAAPMEAPQEVKVYVRGKRSIRVKWRGVSTGILEEPLVGYTIRFWRQSENRYLASDVDAGKNTDYVVDGLDLNTMYELRVLGYSRGGDGLMSSPIIQFVLGKNCYIKEVSPEKEYVYKCSSCAAHSSLALLLATLIAHYVIDKR